MPIPSVSVGKPKEERRFEHFSVDGIDIYVAKTIDVKDNGLRLYMEGLGFLSRVGVDGIKLF